MIYTVFFTYWTYLFCLNDFEYGLDLLPRIMLITAFILVCIAGAAHLILLTTAVNRDANRKKLGARVVWTVLSFLFGVPVGLLYALFTFKAGKYENMEDNKKNVIRTVLSVLLLIIWTAGSVMLIKYSDDYPRTHFINQKITYENEAGEDVIYDKMGNSYNFTESQDFRYYDREGNIYQAISHIDYDRFTYDDIDIKGYKCIENQKEYRYDQGYDFCIDSDGYFIILPDDNEFEYSDLGVYYDKNKNIYYCPGYCYWTPDGNLKYTHDAFEYDKITYQDILDNQ